MQQKLDNPINIKLIESTIFFSFYHQKTNLCAVMLVFPYSDEVSLTAGQEFQSVVASLQTTVEEV